MQGLGLREVAWQNALLPWIVLAVVMYAGVLFNFWTLARKGKLDASPLAVTLRTTWWPVVVIAAALGLVVLGFVISKAYDHSRWPMRPRGTAKALWIGLIPVVSVLASSCLALLLFGPTTPDATADTTAPPAAAPQPGEPCVRCQAATSWNEPAQRFRCSECRVYQPVGPKAV